jgi:hypothetical protein
MKTPAGVIAIGGWDAYNHDRQIVSLRENTWRPTPEALSNEAGELARQLKLRGDMSKRFSIEVGPEANIDVVYKKDMALMQDTLAACTEAIRVEDNGLIQIIGPSVSNLARDGRKYMKRLIKKHPLGVLVNFHPYRTGSEADDFGGMTPREMAEWLMDTLEGRKFGITEAGWHDAKYRYFTGPFGCKKVYYQWTQAQVAEFAAWDIDYWKALRAEFYTWYQVRDGEAMDPDPEAHFGAFNEFGEAKPVAAALKEARDGL